MPQTFQVLRCYECSTFQAHQTTKSNKWECRLCGKKQSLKRYYGLGTAKECRFQVQKLNGMRGELENKEKHSDKDSDSSNSNDEEADWAIEPVKAPDEPIKKTTWSQYLEEQGPIKINTNTHSSGDEEVVFEIPKKQIKLNSKSLKTNPTFSTNEASPVMPKALGDLVKTESKPLQTSFHSEVYHPEETFNNIEPSDKKFVPVAIKKSTSPDLTEQTSLLPPFENLDSLCSDSDSMMAKPFTWREDTNDLDALNI